MTAKPEAVVDLSESLLTYLLCADNDDFSVSTGFNGRAVELTLHDAGKKLGFRQMRPRQTFTVDQTASRDFAITPDYLLRKPQETIGKECELAMFSPDGQAVNWFGFRKLQKRPRGVWVERLGCDLYEVHHRKISATGHSTYGCGVAALDRAGRPAAAAIEGYKTGNPLQDSIVAIMCASVVEDAHRIDAFTARIASESAIIFPIKAGEHLEAFALRDGPLAASGRRKALLHWVSSHVRRKPNGGDTNVSKHTRGACNFTVEGLSVSISENEVPAMRAA
jgi:hypothetical protein